MSADYPEVGDIYRQLKSGKQYRVIGFHKYSTDCELDGKTGVLYAPKFDWTDEYSTPITRFQKKFVFVGEKHDTP